MALTHKIYHPIKCISRPQLSACYLHVSTRDDGKYRDYRKWGAAKRERETRLKAQYDRLDVEDRPTGCLLCPHRNPDVELDYRNVRLLSQFVSPHTGKTYSAAITGLCERKQKELEKTISQSQHVGLMPMTMKYFDFHNDPKLF